MQRAIPESPPADTCDIEKCLNTAKTLPTSLHGGGGHLGVDQIPNEKSRRSPALPNSPGQISALIFIATNKKKSCA